MIVILNKLFLRTTPLLILILIAFCNVSDSYCSSSSSGSPLPSDEIPKQASPKEFGGMSNKDQSQFQKILSEDPNFYSNDSSLSPSSIRVDDASSCQDDISPPMELSPRDTEWNDLTSERAQSRAISFFKNAEKFLKGKKKNSSRAKKYCEESAALGYIPALLVVHQEMYKELDTMWKIKNASYENSLDVLGEDKKNIHTPLSIQEKAFGDIYSLEDEMARLQSIINEYEQEHEEGILFDYGDYFSNAHGFYKSMFDDHVFETGNKKPILSLTANKLEEIKQKAIIYSNSQIAYLEKLKININALSDLKDSYNDAFINDLKTQIRLENYLEEMQKIRLNILRLQMEQKHKDIIERLWNDVGNQDESLRSSILRIIKAYCGENIISSSDVFCSIRKVRDKALTFLPTIMYEDEDGETSGQLGIFYALKETHDRLSGSPDSLKKRMILLEEAYTYLNRPLSKGFSPSDPDHAIPFMETAKAVQTRLAKYHTILINEGFDPYQRFLRQVEVQNILHFTNIARIAFKNLRGKSLPQIKSLLEYYDFFLCDCQIKQDIWIHKTENCSIRVKKSLDPNPQFTVGFLNKYPGKDKTIARDETNEIFKASWDKFNGQLVLYLIPSRWSNPHKQWLIQNYDLQKEFMKKAH